MHTIGWVPMKAEKAGWFRVRALPWMPNPRLAEEGLLRVVSPEFARRELQTFVEQTYGPWADTHLEVPGEKEPTRHERVPLRRPTSIFDATTNPVVLRAKTWNGTMALWVDRRYLKRETKAEKKRAAQAALRAKRKK